MDLAALDPALDLILEREVDAPRALLWDCWTQAQHIPHFFVPRPHKVTAALLDARPGGAFNTTFDVEGTIMENRGVFLEVIEDEKLVFTDTYSVGWNPAPEPFMTAILHLSDTPGGKTRYTAIARHRTPETAQQHKDMGFHEGWGIVVDQLESYAQSLMARTLSLSLDATVPPATLWAALIDPARLVQWWGPDGFTCQTRRIDVAQGGEWVFDMTGPDGTRWPNVHRYTRVIPGRKLAYDLLGGDPDSADGAAPHAQSTITLTPTADGGTRIDLRMLFADEQNHAMALEHHAAQMGLQTLRKWVAAA